VDDVALVTGASGFVGSAVVSALTRRDPSGTVAATRRPCPVPSGVRLALVEDIGPETDWRPALNDVTHLVHCAARVHVMREGSHALADYRRVNTEGTLCLARQAAASGVRRLVFLSTVKVHGESTDPGKPFREADRPDPHGPYARSKLEAEEGLGALARETDLEVVVIRPVLVYGPGVKGNFRSMMRWLSRGVPLPFGLVRNRRSFVGRGNLVDLILTCLDHPAAANETFLVSDGRELSTADLLRKTGAALGRPARLIPVPPSVLNVGAFLVGAGPRMQRLTGSLQVDIEKASRLLDWTPPISLEDELARTAAHFLAHSLP